MPAALPCISSSPLPGYGCCGTHSVSHGFSRAQRHQQSSLPLKLLVAIMALTSCEDMGPIAVCCSM